MHAGDPTHAVGAARPAAGLAMASLGIDATEAQTFVIEINAARETTLSADVALPLASVAGPAAANPFAPANAAATLGRLGLKSSGVRPAAGHAFGLAVRPATGEPAGEQGHGLWLVQVPDVR